MRDLWRPGGGQSGLTWRLLQVLLDHLPPESATKTAIRESLTPEQLDQVALREPDGSGPWSHLEMLTAAAVDALRQIRHTILVANGGKGEPPKPIPRPGVDGGRRRGATPQEAAYLQGIRDRHREQQRQHAGG